MLARRSRVLRRTGTASVEAAVVLNFVLLPLMIGVWEMGRVVQAQQVVANAAREGARLAAQGRTVTRTGVRTITVQPPESPAPYGPNVKDTVFQALVTGGLPGLSKSDVTFTFQFLDGNGDLDSSVSEPFEAPKLQRFRIFVSIPFEKIRWVNLGLVNPETISYTVDWYMLVDDPFVVNPNMPQW